MATGNSTRARKAQTRTARNEALRLELIGVRAACSAAVGALQTRPGLDRDLATVMHRLALRPLDAILADLEGGAR